MMATKMKSKKVTKRKRKPVFGTKKFKTAIAGVFNSSPHTPAPPITKTQTLPTAVLDILRPMWAKVEDASVAYNKAMTLVLAPLGITESMVKKIDMKAGTVEYTPSYRSSLMDWSTMRMEFTTSPLTMSQ